MSPVKRAAFGQGHQQLIQTIEVAKWMAPRKLQNFFVAVGGNRAVLLEPGEEALNQVARLVEVTIPAPLLGATALPP
ncbi:hypothetical protein [Azohydromonas caseinilytica]|uniref:hypothetical protein n=1 Tax=Azohydromonas caseinilytica TaxID=2728836 RepID=UPI00197C384D|nr:hypothetical protein [Azohydromonas caseinilytica]